jgi:DNA primase
VRRHDGKLVGMTGRYYFYPNSPTKYHNYAGLNKSRYLYGEHLLKHKEPIIVCEGQIDAILTWQYLGIPTVAILGEGFGAAHAKTIAAFEPPVVYLFFDNDAAGRMAAEKVEYQLHGRVKMKLMVPPLDMDPGDMSKEQTEKALKEAIPITPNFVWSPDVFISHGQ